MVGISEQCKAFVIWVLTMIINVMIVGQKWLAEQLLKHCLDNSNINVVAVSPPNLNDRLAKLATRYNVPVVLHGKQLTANHVSPFGADIILCAHAYCFITAEARQLCQHGAVGYHPSLLPAYKGKNAIADAFNAGEQVTGGSLYQLDDGWDTGKVLLQEYVVITESDTLVSLWQTKLAPLGVELFNQYLSSKITDN